MWLNPQFSADFVTFTEEILNGKLHFLCNVVMVRRLAVDYEIQRLRLEMISDYLVNKVQRT